MVQPDIGESVLLIVTWISVIFVSGMNIYFIFALSVIVISGFFSLIFFSPEKFNYILSRISSFIDPSNFPIFFAIFHSSFVQIL